MRTPEPDEIEAFFAYDGWTEVRSTDHTHYQKTLPSGELLESHASFGSRPLGPGTFMLFLSMQVKVSQSEFWEVLRSRKPAPRPSPSPEPPPRSLPIWLARALEAAGVPREQLAEADEAEARRILDEIRAQPPE